MKKVSVLFCLLIPFIVFAAEVTRGPYTEDPTLSTAVLKWSVSRPAVSWLEYGPFPKCNQIMANSPEGMDHKVVLHGLTANKEYCYKVYVLNNAEDGVQTPVTGTFKTLYSPERKEVKFVVFGNTAGGGELLSSLTEKVSSLNPDFYVHTGNIVSTGSNADADKEFFTPFAEVLRKAPMFIAVGEKEYGPDGKKPESRNFFRQNYGRSHTMTWGKGSPNYYYFDTANARFIFLDTSRALGAAAAPEINKDSAQYTWLKNSLATTDAGKWKIVFMHGGAYSTGANGSNEEIRDAFSSLFEYYGVNAVIQGGDFDYERTFPVRGGAESPRGVPYITFGTGAAPELTKREFKDEWTARFFSGQVYGVAEIVDRKLTIKVYSTDGKLIETAEIYM